MKKNKNDLEINLMILHKLFHKNHMLQNPGKCHYTEISNKVLSHKIILNNKEITISNEGKPLGILLGSILNFHSHIKSPCKKEHQKLRVIA